MSDKTVSRKLPWLGGALALQLVVAGLLLWQDRGGELPEREALLSFDSQAVDRVEVVVGDEQLLLGKEGEHWYLPNDLPADDAKVNRFLAEMSALDAGWPVADTASARRRFEVADDQFKRKVTLFDGDREVGVLYLGTAPSFRQAHVRRAGEDGVYAVNYNAHSLAAKEERWLDNSLVQPSGQVKKIAAGDFVATWEDDKWSTTLASETAQTGAAAGEEDGAAQETEGQVEPTPAFNAAVFVRDLQELQVLGLAEALAELDAPDAAEIGTPAEQEEDELTRFSVTVTTDSGEYQYELLKKNFKYYIRRNDYDVVFRLGKREYDNFADLYELGSSDQPKAS